MNDLTKEVKQGYSIHDDSSKPIGSKLGRPKKREDVVLGRERPADDSNTRNIERPVRIPVHDQRLLSFGVKLRKGFVTRIVVARPVWLERLMKAGYVPRQRKDIPQPEEVDLRKIGCYETITLNPSSGEQGIVMDIPEELYRADQEAKMKDLDDQMESLTSLKRDQNQYVPQAVVVGGSPVGYRDK